MPFDPILINLPVEIDAGDFATTMEVQGETVKYNKVHVPLEYTTISGDVTAETMRKAIEYIEDPVDQTKVKVDLSGASIVQGPTTYNGGRAVFKALFKKALEGTALKALEFDLSGGIVYADNTTKRDTRGVQGGDPVKFYLGKETSQHKSGLGTDLSGATLANYLRMYLYDNLSAAIGLAATSGDVNVTLSRGSDTASEIIAEALAKRIAGEQLTNETGHADIGIALRQNMYEQMFVLAPERFKESDLMRKPGTPAKDDIKFGLPFQVGDTLAFLVTFKFPASQITAPLMSSLYPASNSTYVNAGDKITVTSSTTAAPNLARTPATASGLTTSPMLSNFPDCTVLLRAKLNA
jgi:hypothetical protein